MLEVTHMNFWAAALKRLVAAVITLGISELKRLIAKREEKKK